MMAENPKQVEFCPKVEFSRARVQLIWPQNSSLFGCRFGLVWFGFVLYQSLSLALSWLRRGFVWVQKLLLAQCERFYGLQTWRLLWLARVAIFLSRFVLWGAQRLRRDETRARIPQRSQPEIFNGSSKASHSNCN